MGQTGGAVLNIEQTLQTLASERLLFHSEADFQHALAWKIHEQHPDARIRLEVPSANFGKRERIDIVINAEGRKYALELKYKKRTLNLALNDEKFSLSNDGAQDIGRYDFVKDIVRLERYVLSEENTIGYAILLTNDDLYWKESVRGVSSAAFFLHEGRTIDSSAPLAWHESTGEGTMKGRHEPFTLRTNYTIHWKDYSAIAGSQFRYLLLTVAR